MRIIWIKIIMLNYDNLLQHVTCIRMLSEWLLWSDWIFTTTQRYPTHQKHQRSWCRRWRGRARPCPFGPPCRATPACWESGCCGRDRRTAGSGHSWTRIWSNLCWPLENKRLQFMQHRKRVLSNRRQQDCKLLCYNNKLRCAVIRHF